MLAESQTAYDAFLPILRESYSRELSDGLLGKARAEAWARFLDLGLPERKDEAFRKIRLHDLYARSFVQPKAFAASLEAVEKALLPECCDSALVFVNGQYQPELSRCAALPKSLVVAPLSEAANTYGSFLQNRWTDLQGEQDPFAALNMAAHGEGAFLYLPANSICSVPIQLLHLVTEEQIIAQPRQQVVVGAGSELQLIATTDGVPNSWTNHSIDISQGENSKVSLIQATPELPLSAWHTDSLRVDLKRDAILNHCSLTTGSVSHRSSYSVAIAGPGAAGNLAALTALHGRRESHAHILIDHQAPHCDSRQLFKTVLVDESRASFEGKILVRQAAQKTDAFQLNNNLVLDRKAHADSKPNLEIFADDVKASHGATIGQLDVDSLFYMKTRGIPEAEARQILLQAYAEELISELPLASLKKQARKMIERLG
jgi:Fe-S cluster assembly protein SufD